MTETAPFDGGHATITALDTYRNNFLADKQNQIIPTSTIADHINYQLSQYSNTATTATTSTANSGESPITTFINNHTANNNDLIDRSNQNQVERVLEWSPNRRYCRLNTLLGKGAFKVVHKAMDLEEGYEVAWNVLHVMYLYQISEYTNICY